MKGFSPGRGETTRGRWRPEIIAGERLCQAAPLCNGGPSLLRLRVQIARRRLPAMQHDPARGACGLSPLRKGVRRMDRDVRILRRLDDR